ncbi:hypothetical protein Nmel_006576 [Mimus melanotis]
MTWNSKIVFPINTVGKEPPWRESSHPNGHSQSSSLDQVYSGTTGKTHSLQSSPFLTVLLSGFSVKDSQDTSGATSESCHVVFQGDDEEYLELEGVTLYFSSRVPVPHDAITDVLLGEGGCGGGCSSIR